MAQVTKANEIIDEYQAAGYALTLRQLYYQFVARGEIENTERSYKNLGALLVRARMSGLVDWDAIEDRTRNLVKWIGHSGPRDPIVEARDRFNLDKWERQPTYVEVWVEKEALAGVFRRVCSELEVPLFACRGYPSKSEMYSAAMRLRRKHRLGKEVTILHFGDHDPSGIDMTRDIVDQMATFGAHLDVERLALNMEQVEEYEPPPNPAKMSDSRANSYVEAYGFESWELDALEPAALEALVRSEVLELRDEELWDEALEEEAEGALVLEKIVERFEDVVEFVER